MLLLFSFRQLYEKTKKCLLKQFNPSKGDSLGKTRGECYSRKNKILASWYDRTTSSTCQSVAAKANWQHPELPRCHCGFCFLAWQFSRPNIFSTTLTTFCYLSKVSKYHSFLPKKILDYPNYQGSKKPQVSPISLGSTDMCRGTAHKSSGNTLIVAAGQGVEQVIY